MLIRIRCQHHCAAPFERRISHDTYVYIALILLNADHRRSARGVARRILARSDDERTAADAPRCSTFPPRRAADVADFALILGLLMMASTYFAL